MRAIDAASQQPNLEIIVFPSPVAGIHRETIISIVAEHRIPRCILIDILLKAVD